MPDIDMSESDTDFTNPFDNVHPFDNDSLDEVRRCCAFPKAWREEPTRPNFAVEANRPEFLRAEIELFSVGEINTQEQDFVATYDVSIFIRLPPNEFKEYQKDPRRYKPEFHLDCFPYNVKECTEVHALKNYKGGDWLNYYELKRYNVLFQCKTYHARFVQPFELEHFPFDVQPLRLKFLVATCGVSVIPGMDKAISGKIAIQLEENFMDPVGPWSWLGKHEDCTSIYQATSDRFEVTGTFFIRRNSSYYFWNILFVLALITGFAPFAVLMEDITDALGHTGTIFLTTIAFLYIVQEHLPVTKYLTVLHRYVFFCITYTGLVSAYCGSSAFIGDDAKDLSSNSSTVVLLVIWMIGQLYFTYICVRASKSEMNKLVLRSHKCESYGSLHNYKKFQGSIRARENWKRAKFAINEERGQRGKHGLTFERCLEIERLKRPNFNLRRYLMQLRENLV